MSEDLKYTPHVLSDEEIEMYLKGDRRDIDRLLLYSINRLTAVIVPHAKREDARDAAFDIVLGQIGGAQAIIDRARFVDSQINDVEADEARKAYLDALIKRQASRNLMMEKVGQSTLTWALIAFFGFIAVATWHEIVAAVKALLHMKVAV